MDFFGILFDMKNGKKVPYSKTYFDTLFAAKLGGSDVKTITGTLPLTFRTSETALRSYTIYGNNYEHTYSATGTLPLTVATHTAGAASDWVIEGNDDNGTENIFNAEKYVAGARTVNYGISEIVFLANEIAITPNTNFDSWYVGIARRKRDGNVPINVGTQKLKIVAEGEQTYALNFTSSNTVSQCYLTFTNENFETLNENYILFSSAHLPLTFTTPQGTKYIFLRLGNNNVDSDTIITNVMLVKGSTAPDHYIPYQQGVGQRTAQLFDKTTATEGYRIANDGAPYPDPRCKLSDYIEVLPNTTYSVNTKFTYDDAMAQYDESKTFIERTVSGSEPFTTTSSTKYVRISMLNDNANTKMLVEGSTAPAEYIPYGYEIPLTINDTPQTFYIGNSPLTAGQSISKTSTGIDIAAMAGSNTITTDLYNKPSMSIEGVDYVGVGEPTNDGWQIPLTVTHYTDNIFDKDAKNTNKGYEDSVCIMWAGSIPYPYMTGDEDNNYFVSEKIPASPNTTYYLTDGIFKNTDNGIYSVFLWNRYRMSDYQAFPTEKTFTTGDDTKFIQLCVLKAYADTVMITTKPTETYIPHVEVNNVNVPIDAPLTDGQSVTDTLTINTFEGENVLDTTLDNKPQMSITYKGG